MATRRFLSVDNLAKYLGISTNTIYFWVCQRKIPYYKVGKYLRFDEGEIAVWLKEKRVIPISI